MSRDRLVLLAGLFGACLVLLANAWSSIETTVDDAWISARYSLHFAEGHGLVYNIGEPPVEGYTNLAWVVLVGIAHGFGVPMHECLTWGGLVWGALGLAGALGLTCHLSGHDHPANLLAPLVLALVPQYAIASTIGLESSMFTACVVLATWAMLAAATPRARLRAGLVAGALATVRPEGALVGAVLVLYDLYRNRHQLTRAEGWVPAAAAAAVVAVLLGWRWSTYHDIVPNTYYAKANIKLERLTPMNIRYLRLDGMLWFVVVGASLITPLLPPRSAERTVPTLAAMAVFLPAMQVPMWMPSGRLLQPVLALAACAAVAHVVPAPRAPWTWQRQVLGAVLVLLAAFAVVRLQKRPRNYDRIHSVTRDNPVARASRHLAQHAPPDAVLAVRDAGVMAFHVGTGVKVIETHNRALTLKHNGRRDIDVRKLGLGNPTFVVLTQQRRDSTEPRYINDGRLWRSLDVPYDYLGRVYQHYHRYYDIYARTDAQVPPLPSDLVMNRKGPVPPSR